MIVLMICDGLGLADPGPGNAVALASTPNLDRWMREYPWVPLHACCEHVGLPPGQMGNSEVGHLNIGAGRVVFSPLMRLNREIANGSFQNNPVLLGAMTRAGEKGRPIHLMGMLSDGGVHSHRDHLFTLMEMARDLGVRFVVHVFLDGRDTGPRVAEGYLRELEDRLARCACGRIADIAGRYYSMDRDNRWERTELGYDALVRGEGLRAPDALTALRDAYHRGEGDEFVMPTVICPLSGDGETCSGPVAGDLIRDGDEVIFFNFRPDRARQLSHALTDRQFSRFRRADVRVNLTTMMRYEEGLDAAVAFPPLGMENVLGQILSEHGLTQLRITETEKFAHVTFFLNGGREDPFPGEDRIMIPSPKVATYDLLPEMSAPKVVDALLPKLDDYDAVIMNFANGDMVGHTGVLEAAVRAVETVDRLAGVVVDSVLERGGTVLLTSDHGNAETMLDEEGTAITAHSLNPVPFIWIGREARAWKEHVEGTSVTKDGVDAGAGGGAGTGAHTGVDAGAGGGAGPGTHTGVDAGAGGGAGSGMRDVSHPGSRSLFEGAIPSVAPTMLRLLGVPVPGEMTAPCLIPDRFFEFGARGRKGDER